MLSLVPAVVGFPGGIELLVIFFVLFLLFGVPVALALLLGYRYVKGQAGEDVKAERIAELEAELAELRDAVENNPNAGTSTDTPGAASSTDSTGTASATDSATPTSPEQSTDSPGDSAPGHGVNEDE